MNKYIPVNDNTSINYENIWKAELKSQTKRWDRVRFNAMIEKVKDGDRVLDLACWFTDVLQLVANKRKNCGLYGIDFCESAIKEMKDFNPLFNVKVGDVLSTGYPNNYFNVVMGGEIIEHQDIPGNLLKEMLRITKHGGWISLSCPNDELNVRGKKDPYHLWTFTASDLIQMLTGMGCVNVESRVSGLYLISHGQKI